MQIIEFVHLNLAFRFLYLKEFDYVRMVQSFHDPDLPEEFLKTSRVELSLINDLDSDLLARGDVLGQLDLGKVTLPDGLEKPVLANVRLLASSASRDPGAGLALKINDQLDNCLLASYKIQSK